MSKGSLTALRHFLVACVLCVACNAGASDGGMPDGLRCLQQHYSVTAVNHDGRWCGQLPDGGLLPWEDGQHKTAQKRLASPDLSDVFAERYETGALTVPLNDAGRVRVDALFKATFGDAKAKVDVVPFVFFGQSLLVHRRVVAAFEAVRTQLQALVKQKPSVAVFLARSAGTFQWRVIEGTSRLSAHSFGVSIDLNVLRSNYWRWDKKPLYRNQIPEEIVRAFELHGFIWGGRWVHYDTMHFEFRPELLDARCYD